jgi:isoleucyl-tRNA synthetase
LMTLDKWALAKLNALIQNVDEAYANYEFYKVYHLMNNFVTIELSSVYLDVLKDRLYTWKANGKERRAAQTVLYAILTKMTGLMAPILTFLAEETYSYLPGQKKESVFLTDFPKKVAEWDNDETVMRFEDLLQIRTDASKVLEELRQTKTIGASLEAELEVTADGDRYKVLESYARDLRAFFIVSKVTLKQGKYALNAVKSNGKKCVRCWSYYSPQEENSKFPEVCPKCVEALS